MNETSAPTVPAPAQRPLRRRGLAGGLLAAAAAGVVLGVAGPASAAPSNCAETSAGDCIVGLGTYRTPDSITVDIQTSVPTTAYASATAASDHSTGYVLDTNSLKYNHSLTIHNLHVAKDYTTYVKAWDAKGGVHTEKLSVKTRGIKTVTTIDNVSVYENGDVGDAEIYGHVGIANVYYSGVYKNKPMADHSTYAVGRTITSYDLPSLRLRTQLVDDDCDIFCSGMYHTPPFTDPLVENGEWVASRSNSDYDLASVDEEVSLAEYSGQGRHDLFLMDNGNNRLNFGINAHVVTTWTG